MSREQRRFPRIGPVLVRAECRVGDNCWEGYLTSLSEGGAYLVSNQSLQDGEHVALDFFLPWQLGRVEVDAVVVYVITESDTKPEGYPAGVGLSFVAPDAKLVDQFRRYVARFQEIADQLWTPG